MISAQSIRNRTHLSITNEGKETLRFLNGKLHDALRAERVIRIVRRPFRRARNPPDAGLRRLEFDAELREHMRREALLLMQETQQ